MPYGKKRYSNKKYKKRSYRKRKRKQQIVSTGSCPVTKTAIVKMRYCDTVVLNPETGICGSHIFQANGTYDPNITSVGHQPMGWDQWMTFYNHAKVLGSKMTATLVSQPTCPLQMGITLKDNANLLTSPQHCKERANTNWRYQDINGTKGCKVVSKFSTKRFFGVKSAVDPTNLYCNAGSNAGEGAYWHLWCASADEIADPGQLTIQILIDFIVQLSEPTTVAQS